MKQLVNHPKNQDNNCKNDLGWGQLLLFFITIFGVLVFIIIITVTIEVFTVQNIFEAYPTAITLAEYLAYLMTLCFFKSIRNFLKDSFSFIPFKKGKTYVYLLGSFFVLYAFNYLFIEVLKLEDFTESYELLGMLDNTSYSQIALIYVTYVIVGPIYSELIYRGIIFGFLASKYKVWIGTVVSAIIFSLLSLQISIVLIFMGVLLVFLYIQSKSLVVPIVFHMIWNLYAITSFYMFH